MKKLMFNDKYGLTKAVLEGRKTMTRRIAEKVLVEDIDQHLVWTGEFKKPKYKVGEVVAVAQSYHCLNKSGYVAPEWLDHYCEDSAGYENKMFVRADLMPHQIRITDVRIERLQEISDKDCMREGIYVSKTEPFVPNGYSPYCANDPKEPKEWFHTPREAFAALIDEVSGKGTWQSNPWVFVYQFELVN